MAMGKCGAYVELLDMAARVAVRTYGHLPQTSRTYYKPPTTKTTTTAATRNGGASARASGRSSDGEAKASSARRNQQQQQLLLQATAVRVAFDATEIMFSGIM